METVAVWLAFAWLLLGAATYLAAHQRMLLITGKDPWWPSLVAMDFTVAYLLLLVATVVFALLKWMRRRPDGPPA